MRRQSLPLLIALANVSSLQPHLARAEEPPGQPTEATSESSKQPEGARVLFVSNRSDAALEKHIGSVDLLSGNGSPSGTTNLWARVCLAPCEAWVDPSGEFRIGGEGVSPSSSFTLAPQDGPLRIDANAGSQRALSLGKTFVSTGIGLLALGTLLLVVPKSGDDPSSTSAFKTLRGVGYGALGAGSALMLTGIPLWVANGTTIKMSQPPISAGGRPSGIVLGAERELF